MVAYADFSSRSEDLPKGMDPLDAWYRYVLVTVNGGRAAATEEITGQQTVGEDLLVSRAGAAAMMDVVPTADSAVQDDRARFEAAFQASPPPPRTVRQSVSTINRIETDYGSPMETPMGEVNRIETDNDRGIAAWLLRRLSDTGDVALPALRSAAAAPALPREDGITLRDTARHLSEEEEGADANVARYKEKLQKFTECIATYERSVKDTLAAMMMEQETEKLVSAFYSNTALILASCHNTVAHPTPSECPINMFDKEVYFMFGVQNQASSDYGRTKTMSYIDVGTPAASRLDRLMNALTELFAAA